ncbi:kelch_domain-containing protein [Hexamita inflata]|uniref:Putative n=1 Tax=Hexamita inflata TaxID=28002 RepID=A0ABP1IL07_9EUKA
MSIVHFDHMSYIDFNQQTIEKSQQITQFGELSYDFYGKRCVFSGLPDATFLSNNSLYFIQAENIFRLNLISEPRLSLVIKSLQMRHVRHQQLFILHNTLYVFSGLSLNAKFTMQTFQSVDLLNPRKLVNVQCSNLPPSRCLATIFSSDSAVYILSGLSSTATEERILGDLWKFDGSEFTQIELSGSNPEVCGAQALLFNHYFLIVGGFCGQKLDGSKQLNSTVWVLDCWNSRCTANQLGIVEGNVVFRIQGGELVGGGLRAQILQLKGMEAEVAFD